MITVHSLSGGKTSSYMAIHYPADYNIFSLVTIKDDLCTPKDKSLVKSISDKIGKDFIATAEDDATLYAVFDLEQKIGTEIIWVAGETFDDVISRKGNYVPGQMARYCTTELKVKPIFEWWQKNIGEKVKMGIGYRYDEIERADKFKSSFRAVVGKYGSRNKWEDIDWRDGWFPLIENKIIYPKIVEWALSSGISFPSDSNCVGCFHKPLQQLRKNFIDNQSKMEWFLNKEKMCSGTWKKGYTYEQIRNMPIQQDFMFGTGSGCQAGFCTD